MLTKGKILAMEYCIVLIVQLASIKQRYHLKQNKPKKWEKNKKVKRNKKKLKQQLIDY
jgi:hypothetical protein